MAFNERNSVGTPSSFLSPSRVPFLGRVFQRITSVLCLIGSACLGIKAQTVTLACPQGFNTVDAPLNPAVLMASLKSVPNPILPTDAATGVRSLRPDLTNYVADLASAIQLGKALFWDMQAGSDDRTSCATCHHSAGVDLRARNQINPGPDKVWSPIAGAVSTLTATNFPFTDLNASPSRNADTITGSQGVRKNTFSSLDRTKGTEVLKTVKDTVYNVKGVNTRQVTARNTSTTINSVFNHRLFHDGRSQPDFNGVNHLGYRDKAAKVWAVSTGAVPYSVDIKILNAALASQAVAPILNGIEMSATGRTLPDVGAKLLLRKPLGFQAVSTNDSVLGPIADTTTGVGLKLSYANLIQRSFQPMWWNSTKPVIINRKSYSMMEANFSLYWGIAIMLYEATLVSDESPMDQYLATRTFTRLPDGTLEGSGNEALLDPVIDRLAKEGIAMDRATLLKGLRLFELPVAPPPSFPVPTDPKTLSPKFGAGCIACHLGAETTSASIRNLAGHGIEPGDIAFKNAGFDLRMERMFSYLGFDPRGPLTPVPVGTDRITVDTSTYTIKVASVAGNAITPAIPLPIVTYDSGWYNIGVRPTAEDVGLGGLDPSGLPLSWTEFLQKTLPDPRAVKIPGGGISSQCTPPGSLPGSPFYPEVLNPYTGFPLLSGPLLPNEATGVAGSFKTPGLRNVELTGPYFHNGGKSTLAQVVEFYDMGGDFANATKSPLMVPLMLSKDQTRSLLAFLVSLTDERVLFQKAPFDHPQLFIPNGVSPTNAAIDQLLELPAVGAQGGPSISRFLSLNPFN